MNNSVKKHTWALKLFLSIYLLSQIFTLLHLPYVQVLTILSALVLVAFYPFRYAAKPNKAMLDHVKMAWVLSYAVQTVFQLEHYMPLTVFQTILFLFWFLNEGFFYFDFNFSFRKTKEQEQNILDDFEEEKFPKRSAVAVDVLLVLCALLFIVSVVFNFLHLPGVNIMLLIAYAVFAVLLWFKKF